MATRLTTDTGACIDPACTSCSQEVQEQRRLVERLRHVVRSRDEEIVRLKAELAQMALTRHGDPARAS